MKYSVYQYSSKDNIKLWCGLILPNKGVFTSLNDAYRYRDSLANRYAEYIYQVEERE